MVNCVSTVSAVVDTTGLVSVVSSVLVGDGSGSSSCSGVLAITPDGEISPTAPKVIHAGTSMLTASLLSLPLWTIQGWSL